MPVGSARGAFDNIETKRTICASWIDHHSNEYLLKFKIMLSLINYDITIDSLALRLEWIFETSSSSFTNNVN